MRIGRVVATAVRVPRLQRFRPMTAHGESLASDYVLIEIFTDDGVVGVGEVTCSPGWNGEEALGTIGIVREKIGPILRGSDPLSWGTIAPVLDRLIRGRPFLRAAIEMACLDAAGQALGVPVAMLLGGICREHIPTKFVLPARDVERVRAMAEDLAQYRPGAVKVKVGTNVADDVARVRAVRDVLGNSATITVDANEGWRREDASRALRELHELGVSVVEQPLPRASWRATASLRKLSASTIMADESVWNMEDLIHAYDTGAFDMINIYPGKCGGVRDTLFLGKAALHLGIGVSFGSNLELGVGSAALAHSIAAFSELSPSAPSDLIGPLYFESALVTDAEFVAWGSARLPSGAGLGVSLDRQAVEHYQIR